VPGHGGVRRAQQTILIMFKFFEFNGVVSCHSWAIDETAIYVESIGYKNN